MTVDGGDSRLGTCGKLAQSVPFLRWLILVHSEQHKCFDIGAVEFTAARDIRGEADGVDDDDH